MSKLKKILKIQDWIERHDKLADYAYKEGLSSLGVGEGEAQLIKKITDFERHKTNVMLTKISVAVAIAVLIWGIIYTLFISPPKYSLGNATLHFEKWFGRWAEQAKRKNPQVNIYENNGIVGFQLHFILRNKNRGEGEISKPMLIITAENSKQEFQVTPETESGRTIKVGSYGIVDDFFEYSIRSYDGAQKELLEFLKNNRDVLKFKIKGEPYGEIGVRLVEDYVRH